MSTAAATPAAEPQFDAKAFMESRNKGEPAPKVEVKVEAEPITEKPKADSSRSTRRAINNAIREAAEERGRRLAMEDMIAKGLPGSPAAKETPREETEPKRSQFASGDEGMAEFLRASQKWDKAQEAKAGAKTAEQTAETEALKTYLGEMDAKAVEDIKTLKDWDKVQARAAADEEAPEFVPDEHPTLMALLARSDMRAFVLYHWADPANYDALQALLDEKNQPKQISSFHRLEGRLEKMYDSSRSPEKEPVKAAQASEPEKGQKDRTHLAEAARPGEPQREVPAKPKPSSEVAARGGSPAPDAPKIGSPEWMLERNRAQFGR